MAPPHLLFAFAYLCLTVSFLVVSGQTIVPGQPILDADGDPVLAGAAYHLIAVTPPNNGGVTLVDVDPNHPGTCPQKVGLGGASEGSMTSIPVRFENENSSTALVVGLSVRAKFAFSAHCIPDTWWAIPQPEAPYGGVAYLMPGNPDGKGFEWFFIGYDETTNAYYLVSCAVFGCNVLRVAEQGNILPIVTTINPGFTFFRFVFQKYEGAGQLLRSVTSN